MKYSKNRTHLVFAFLVLIASLYSGCQPAPEKSLQQKADDRDFPSVFQAWNPIDMPEYPLDTNDQRLVAAAKHDLLWEEPVSMLGFGTDLVLGAVWNHEHGGLATEFTPESHGIALNNRKKMLAMNPNMIFLLEVRWRDAPGSFLPEDSEFWRRNDDGTRAEGWQGGPEPYYLIDRDSKAFHENIARQSRLAIESGVYDGVMLDWSGYLPIVKKVREAIGDTGLIIVNIHDDLEKGELYKDYINGSFMECNPDGPGVPTQRNISTWDQMEKALKFFEVEFLEPRINAFEVWGDRKDLRRMRATTTLGLTHSNGYVLYGDMNPLPTPDHMHDWYDFWDIPLGMPKAKGYLREDGAHQREFDGGIVIYNPYSNGPVILEFENEVYSHTHGKAGTSFELLNADGDIFTKP